MLGFVILISIESNLVKPLLDVVTPIALYTLRIGVLATLFLLFTKPDLKKVNKDSFFQTALIAFIVAVEYPCYYYAIQKFGVVETSLIMLLAPVLILFSSKILFKEKLTFKKTISSAIIIACIAMAILIK
jgi:drug/metabolite transporter (DMT)-like permease